jgi:heme oxygenase
MGIACTIRKILRALVSYPRHLRGVETVERGERWREFTEFQAQKKTSEDVFFLFGGPG